MIINWLHQQNISGPFAEQAVGTVRLKLADEEAAGIIPQMSPPAGFPVETIIARCKPRRSAKDDQIDDLGWHLTWLARWLVCAIPILTIAVWPWSALCAAPNGETERSLHHSYPSFLYFLNPTAPAQRHEILQRASSPPLSDNRVFDQITAIQYLGLTAACLKKWRQRKHGPDYIQYGKNGPVRYELKTLMDLRDNPT